MAGNRKAAKGISAGRPRSYTDLYRNSRENVNVAASESNESAAHVATTANRRIDWAHEYGYVAEDLRRLGLVTGVLVIAMIAAGFIL